MVEWLTRHELIAVAWMAVAFTRVGLAVVGAVERRRRERIVAGSR